MARIRPPYTRIVALARCQGEEWRKTSMCGAVEMFSDKFLDELTEANKSNLNAKAREAAAKPTLVW